MKNSWHCCRKKAKEERGIPGRGWVELRPLPSSAWVVECPFQQSWLWAYGIALRCPSKFQLPQVGSSSSFKTAERSKQAVGKGLLSSAATVCRHQRQQHPSCAPGPRHSTAWLPMVPLWRHITSHQRLTVTTMTPITADLAHSISPALVVPWPWGFGLSVVTLWGGSGERETVWEQMTPPVSRCGSGKAGGALEGSVNQRRRFPGSAAWLGYLRLTLFLFCDLITLDWCLCWSFWTQWKEGENFIKFLKFI